MMYVSVQPRQAHRVTETSRPNTATHTATPAANIVELEHAWTIEVAAPGLSREAFRLKIEKDLLTLEADYPQPEVQEQKVWRREFGTGRLSRSFRLPERADTDNIQAKYEVGVLRISIPKKAPVQIRIA